MQDEIPVYFLLDREMKQLQFIIKINYTLEYN